MSVHRNQQLFSDYFLDQTLPQKPEWQALQSQIAAIQSQISALFASYKPSHNEAQLETELVRPILTLLGHTFEVQAALKTPDGTKKPDYVLYESAQRVAAQKNKTLTDALPKEGAIAIADAKAWELNLDRAPGKNSADSLSNKNPSYQIAFYVQHSGLDWGILTNGRLWRLYHKDTAHKLAVFYEVDLPQVLDEGPEALLYFVLFFRRAAFNPDEPLSLATLLKASADFAAGVSASLKTQVFEALRHLAQGFLDYAPNQLSASDPATLKLIYDNSLILLYRLLFVFYAEARGLLPLHHGPYRDDYSLYNLVREGARDLDSGKTLLPQVAKRWGGLAALFEIIDQGAPPLKVTTYNGGLFDPKRHVFLAEKSVGDARLMAALELLARVPDATKKRVFVDYRDLSVRHLGTIYEGLLEYRLVEATSESFTVALENEKGERKASGSYYTPDYIVKFIVEETLGPVLREAIVGKESDEAKTEAILSLNVLDPAMGSGHFLVEATDYIARFLVENVNSPLISSTSPLTPARRGDNEESDSFNLPRRAGVGGVAVSVEGNEPDIAYWKRRVVHSCIYGVDLNPLAVDLAKLSLWLSTLASEKPLSFLDHHLRCGNALVGTRLNKLYVRPKTKQKTARLKLTPQQMTLFDGDAFTQTMALAVQDMEVIELSRAETVQEVKAQEIAYKRLREERVAGLQTVADLAVATRFGLEIDESLWKPLYDYATGRIKGKMPKEFETWLAESRKIRQKERIFHWELEFPEVYFDRYGRRRGADAGFEAIIGNPPYVRQERLTPFKDFFHDEYPDVYNGTADLFVYFFRQALNLLAENGRTSYISSNSWLRANYATPLRGFLKNNTTIEILLDLGDNKVFAEAPDLYPSIHIAKNLIPKPDQKAQVAVFSRGEGLKDFEKQVAEKLTQVSIRNQDDSGWQLGSEKGRDLFKKTMKIGKPLDTVVSGKIFYGIKTGLNEAFIINSHTKDQISINNLNTSLIMKPIVNGEDVRSWHLENQDRWLILMPNGWTKKTLGSVSNEKEGWEKLQQKYPSIATFLEKHADAGKKRSDKGEFWWELRPCSYYDDFNGLKIFWPEMAKQPRFIMGDAGIVGNKTTFMIPEENWFLLGVLMSRVTWYNISKLCVPIGERGGMLRYTLSAQFMSRLPIPETTPEQAEELSGLAQKCTDEAKLRYTLHQKVRRRLEKDLLPAGTTLNQKLSAWWTLDFAGLQAELKRTYKTSIPVAERDDWEAYLEASTNTHNTHTAAIVAAETQSNALVYQLFSLTDDEITQIEESTKYKYGEV